MKCDLKFDFNRIAYTSDLEYKKRTIIAVLDTGATRSTLDIATLAELLAVPAQEIYNAVNNYVNRYKAFEHVLTASGKEDRTIEIKLKNVTLADCTFPEFYFRLNIDNDSWTTYNSSSKNLKHSILIGLDIIRNGEMHGTKDTIDIKGFNVDTYVNEMEQQFSRDKHNVITLFNVLEIG